VIREIKASREFKALPAQKALKDRRAFRVPQDRCS
jgi:hypothetical protein